MRPQGWVVDMRHSENRCSNCPCDCPCKVARQAVSSQQRPIARSMEVMNAQEFGPKNDDGREAEVRLANRRLQPLGHLTTWES